MQIDVLTIEKEYFQSFHIVFARLELDLNSAKQCNEWILLLSQCFNCKFHFEKIMNGQEQLDLFFAKIRSYHIILSQFRGMV